MRTPILALRNRRATQGQHPGLLLQRYLCESATGERGNPEEKQAILQAAINAATHPEVMALYQVAFDRWSASLPADPAPIDLATDGRLIVGLGSENVLETGIRLHNTYGMPVIPGSALKGLAAHYCDQVWGERDTATPSVEAMKFRGPRQEDRKNNRPAEPQGPYHKLLFGATDDSGCIIFHDAWYVPRSSPAPLLLDVMTPHHPKWLDGSVPPTDFDSPIPVPFLSVTGTFRVAVSWHGPTSDQANLWTRLAQALLREALNAWGIGGKTSSGYGRLRALQSSENGLRLGAIASKPTEPKYGPRTKASFKKRTIDGKTRFEADDGFLGTLLKGALPDLADGEMIDLWILRVEKQNKKVPYVLQTEEPPKPNPAAREQERRHGRRNR